VDEVRFMALDAAMATTTYDDFGRVLDQTDAANNTVRYQYDNFGRLEYTWSYDLDGKKRVLERNRIMYHTDPVNRIWNPGRPINRVTKQTALEDVESIAAFNALNLDQRAEQQQFLDGLGRPIQSVDVRSTPLKQDVFQHIAYDSRGLSPRTFLPYVRWMPAEWDANNTERLDPDPLGTLTNYYGGSFQGYGEGVAKDAKPWSDATFEASPAARVLSQGMLGTNWNGKTSTVTTRLNNTTDDVIRFVVHRPAGWVYDMMNPVGSWPAGSLLVQRSVDVDGRAKETFTNLEGQMVLSRVLHRNPPNGTDLNHPSNWAETYYCYDDFGRLCFVFQPEGVNRIRTVNPPHWPYNNYEMSAYLFIYRYDQFGRIVEKCTPGVPKDGSTWGGNTEYIVYNPADMPIAIMTDRGDARTVNGTRQREWSFITYDALGRKARTGLWHDLWDPNRGRAQLQAYVDADLAPTHKPLHESRRFNSNGVHYTRNFFDGGSTELAWSIYDDYDANLDGADDVTLVPNADYGGTLMLAPRHLPTLSYTRVLGTTTFLQSAVGYDLRGRVCQTRETTYLGGFIQTHLKYNTRGEVSHKLITNKRSSNTGDPEYSFEQQQSYDHRGRLRNLHVKTYQGNNSQNTPNRSFAQYDYNELGQQVRKHLFHTGSAWLQQIDYTYNIQGWLTAINDPYNLSNSKLWGMRLQYETPDAPWWTNAEFGGNISTQTWRANGEPLLHRFFYTYDRMNRLNSAGPGGMGAFYISQAPNGGAWSRAHWYHQPIHDYDRNGNLTRFQLIMGDSVNNGGSLAWVDNFSSAPNQIQLYGNRLWNVRDQGSNNGPHGEFKDNTATAANVAEYGYDPSGNITSDANAGISVEYNHLNLVTKITKGTGTIEYTYAADGTLLARRVNGTLHQEWMGGFVYKQGGVLDYIFTPEGRVVRETSGNFVYEYHYTDQVGSLRLAWQALGNIAQAVEVHNYYPYGVRIPRQHGTPTTAHTYQYRYTGQWNETALGLNYYRFEARLYDPALGRWTGVDPMAAKYQDMSPYNYALGNPVRFIDPDGRDPFDGHYLDDLGAVIPRDSPVWAMRHQNRLDNLGLRSLLLQDDPIKGRNVSKKNVMPTDKSKHFGGADLPSGAEEGDLWFNPALGTFIRANGRWQQFDPKSMRGYESAEHRFITNEQAAVDRRRIQDFSIYLLTEAIGAWVQFARAEVQVARAEAQMARSAYSAEIVTSTTNASITPWPAASGGRTVINGIEYTTHALERMQPVGTILKGNEVYSRGVPPSVVENAIKYGKITPGNTAAEVVRTFENITVVTDIEGKRVITVIKKSIK
jgi:RHS repeat-associated protein